MEDLNERRNAELEFIAAAYHEDEAWVCNSVSENSNESSSSSSCMLPKIERRLSLSVGESDGRASSFSSSSCVNFVSVLLTLTLPPEYPTKEALIISATVEEYRNKCPTYLSKWAYNAIPQLVNTCRQTSDSMIGEESVFAVLSQADEWVRETWPNHLRQQQQQQQQHPKQQQPNTSSTSRSSECSSSSSSLILGRRLLYSHHIISKKKRSSMRQLGSHYNLTGYVKIGWPGIIIIEGDEESCQAFCDEIQRWTWKYLVIRGEQQEECIPPHQDVLNTKRCFSEFLEVNDMSLVANHCRQVGLEALFRSSMKQYSVSANDQLQQREEEDTTTTTPYGALVHVVDCTKDDAKGYRRWLRKTGFETETMIMIKQCYPNHDFTQRPIMIVAIVGDPQTVPVFVKRWRTSRGCGVVVDGTPCQDPIKILLEGTLTIFPTNVDWDKANAEESVNVTSDQLIDWIKQIGGEQWNRVLEPTLFCTI